MKTKLCFFLSLLVFSNVILYSEFMWPTLAPADRIITNLKKSLEKDKKNHFLLYTIARVHYLAFCNKTGDAQVFEYKKVPTAAPSWMTGNYLNSKRNQEAARLAKIKIGKKSLSEMSKKERAIYYGLITEINRKLIRDNWQPKPLDQKQILHHANQAQLHFKLSLELDPKNGLYQLGLASLYKQYLNYLKETKLKKEFSKIKGATLKNTKELFYKAFKNSVAIENKLKNKPASGLYSLVGYEAGNAFLKLTESLKSEKVDASKINEIKVHLKKLKKLTSNIITPIIFSLEPHQKLNDLIDSKVTSNFDLSAKNINESWPWLKSNTGILVWDPYKTGIIKDGKQLFGSVTWWLFFENGYKALGALDDDQNGILEGAELIGIRVWFDKNQNGNSDPKEVIDLSEIGIVSISTTYSLNKKNIPLNKKGITLKSGKQIPTYDWIAEAFGKKKNK